MKLLIGYASIGGLIYIPVVAYSLRDAPGLLTALLFVWIFCAVLVGWSFQRGGIEPYRADTYQPPLNAYQRRQAKLQANGGSYTDAEWQALCAQYNYLCLRCNMPRPLTADHVIPVEHGGSSDISNIQPLCRSCNSWKGTRTADYRTQ